MPVTLRPDAKLAFRAVDGTFLYDCHSQRFAATGDGPPIILGFIQFFLAKLFGVKAWQPFLNEAMNALHAMRANERDAFINAHPIKRTLAHATEAALFAYPGAEQFVRQEGDAFVLRDEFLYQPNVALSGLFVKRAGQPRRQIAHAQEPEKIRHGLSQLASGRYSLDILTSDSISGALIRELVAADLLMPARELARPMPGIYLLGHSGVLIVSEQTALLIDPHTSSDIRDSASAFTAQEIGTFADTVLLTHGHFDHYHLPSLLELSHCAVIVPPIPRASIVSEDIAARLRDFGVQARTLPWGANQVIGDLTVHALPFYGEQFLTSERYPQVRNWGNCYVVEYADQRVLIAADAGFEPGHSVIDAVTEWVNAHGRIHTVVTQAIGLVTTLGLSDADLQIAALTSAARAPDAIDLVRPERRVTIACEDLPRLLQAAQAPRVILYGQFESTIGAHAVTPELTVQAAAALGNERLVSLRIGEGVSFDGRRIRSFSE